MKKQQGFTLIEMLVVITMIGMLMAMISGSLISARLRARKARAEVQVRELANAWGQYYLLRGRPAGIGTSFTPMTRETMGPLITPDANGFVYLNITLKGEEESDPYLDPWKTPYHVKFNETPPNNTPTVSIKASVSFINRRRE